MRAAIFFSLASHSKLTDFHKDSVINLLLLNSIYCKEIGKIKFKKIEKQKRKSNRLAKRAPQAHINPTAHIHSGKDRGFLFSK